LNNKISEKDKKDWENFLSNKEKLKNKDINPKKIYRQKVRSLDLHGYTLNEANKRISDFIIQSYSDGINKLIVVTGKGLHSKNENNPYVSTDLSILKFSVPEYIKKNNELMELINDFGDANIEDGGSGSFYIYLKKNKK